MKIAIFSNAPSDNLTSLVEYFALQGLDIVYNPLDLSIFNVAISFGGDGTFLSVAKKCYLAQVPILGINNGRLGFLSSTPFSHYRKAVDDLVSGNYSLEYRTLISVEGYGVALNEFTLQKLDNSMVKVSINIDEQVVADYWADGVIISTPTGSTAYSMSVGGSILTPDCPAFAISPIAPHNLNVRPLIISDSSIIRVSVFSRSSFKSLITLDNSEYNVHTSDSFILSKSKTNLPVIHLSGTSFFGTLRDKLHWAVDLRN